MKNKHKNIFFIFGLVVLGIMITQLDFAEVRQGLSHAGYWFVAVMVLWALLYLVNTWTWYLIIRSTDKTTRLSFLWLYRVTISGFALNYATPEASWAANPIRLWPSPPGLEQREHPPPSSSSP